MPSLHFSSCASSAREHCCFRVPCKPPRTELAQHKGSIGVAGHSTGRAAHGVPALETGFARGGGSPGALRPPGAPSLQAAHHAGSHAPGGGPERRQGLQTQSDAARPAGRAKRVAPAAAPQQQIALVVPRLAFPTACPSSAPPHLPPLQPYARSPPNAGPPPCTSAALDCAAAMVPARPLCGPLAASLDEFWRSLDCDAFEELCAALEEEDAGVPAGPADNSGSCAAFNSE